VNESFYELFNQYFKWITNRTGEVCLSQILLLVASAEEAEHDQPSDA
jgi:hypothetical protein